jgi:hypothetical protein
MQSESYKSPLRQKISSGESVQHVHTNSNTASARHSSGKPLKARFACIEATGHKQYNPM